MVLNGRNIGFPSFKKNFKIIKTFFHKPFFGFIDGHNNLSKCERRYLYSLIGKADAGIIQKYEIEFSKLIGDGMVTSFAAGRMGFFALLKALKIGKNDEVILQGATCAVMANAVMRCEAIPVYADIDRETFGPSIKSIKNMISPRTKMIVAQHSFGIPCDISSIAKLAKENKVFLMEDCALSLGSTVKGQRVGTFGDAALFSTDHTKPINTLIGGLIYTSNSNLNTKLEAIKESSPDIGKKHQKQLFNQLCLEAKYANKENFGKLRLLSAIRRKILRKKSGFFEEDFGSPKPNSSYKYPLKLPSFLAHVGLKEIEKWEQEKVIRVKNGELFLHVLKSAGFGDLVRVYEREDLEIIPLRIAFLSPSKLKLYENLNNFIDCDAIWFREPLVGLKGSSNSLGYVKGSCPRAEEACTMIINLPCNMASNSALILSEKLKNKLESIKVSSVGSEISCKQ